MLTTVQKQAYQEHGFVVVPDAVSAEEIRALVEVTEQFVEQSRSVTEHNDLFDLEPGHSAEEPRLRRIKTPEKWHPTYAALVRHPRIISALQDLWGPAIRYQTSKLNMKVAGYGSSLEWHQDWAFYPHTNDDLAVVGIMLDDIDQENGAMMVIPGSHRGEIFDHSHDGTFVAGINPGTAGIDFTTAVPVCGSAGSMSIHHVRTVHGGAANTSGRDRRYFLLQYRAADAWPLLQALSWDEWTGQLLTGEETHTPRMVALPVRLPLPEPEHQGSIFENQRALAARYFDDGQPTAGSPL